MRRSTQGVETSWRVSSLGPMHCCSFWEALAEIVMMALMKSPAAVWTTQLRSGERQERRMGTTSWV